MQKLPSPVIRYLERLELALKKRVGVSPEEVLCDAREHLCREFQEFGDRHTCNEDVAVEYLVENFGDPEDVAGQYGSSEKAGLRIPGHAPGWRICCTQCGNGAPAAKVGMTRIAAVGEKYTLGWCRECNFFRWMKIQRDLEKPSLTNRLGVNTTPQELRSSSHRPWATVAGIVSIVLVLLLVVQQTGLLAATFGSRQSAESMFENMPVGWSLKQSSRLPRAQVQAIGKKFEAKIESLSNNHISDGKGELQINVARCATRDAAKKLYAAFLNLHDNPRDCIHSGNVVYELVRRSGDVRSLYAKARYELGMQPKSVRYQVTFDAAPIDSGDDRRWNDLFNLFLQAEAGQEVDAKLASLAKSFRFGTSFSLNRAGAGVASTKWKISPKSVREAVECGGDATSHTFERLDKKSGIPVASVRGEVTATTGAIRKSERKHDERLLQATRFWPVGNAKVRQLAAEITSSSDSDSTRVDALLAWFQSEMKFKGKTGSRYGVEKVMEQKYGHCWDFSDLFITLCRAAKIPSRQVAGWMFESEGHVWCEVLVDGAWQQLDPTTGAHCGSDYVPIVLSEDGRIPLVYASSVRVVRE